MPLIVRKVTAMKIKRIDVLTILLSLPSLLCSIVFSFFVFLPFEVKMGTGIDKFIVLIVMAAMSIVAFIISRNRKVPHIISFFSFWIVFVLFHLNNLAGIILASVLIIIQLFDKNNDNIKYTGIIISILLIIAGIVVSVVTKPFDSVINNYTFVSREEIPSENGKYILVKETLEHRKDEYEIIFFGKTNFFVDFYLFNVESDSKRILTYWTNDRNDKDLTIEWEQGPTVRINGESYNVRHSDNKYDYSPDFNVVHGSN